MNHCGRFIARLLSLPGSRKPSRVQRHARAGRAILQLESFEPRVLLDGSTPTPISIVGGPPTARDDIIDTDAGNAVNIQVLNNDTGSGLPLNAATVTVQQAPTNGTVALDAQTGQLVYTPVEGFAGTDSFTYTVQDIHGGLSNPGHVTVVVNRPTANDDFIDTDAGNPVTISVLENDTDPDGNDKLDASSVTVSGAPAHGTTSLDPATGAVTYTPAAGFAGTDTFLYTVSDVNDAVSNPARVTVVVNRPTANDDFTSTNQDTAVTINVAENDTDPDGNDKLDLGSIAIGSSPAHGTATVNGSAGTVTYTPAAGFSGTDFFTYTISDVANAMSNVARVTIAVQRTQIVNDDTADTDAGNGVVLDVLANDTDPSGLVASTLTVVTAPANGTATVNTGTGQITYTPADGFAGTDSFTYTVQNGTGATLGPAHVTVVVNRPTANDDFIDTDAGNPVTISVLENDTDPDGNNMLDPSAVAVTGPPAHGTTSLDSATGAVTYTPAPGFAGTDTFLYTVSDVNHAVSNPARVTVVVNRPTANDDFAGALLPLPITIDVAGNDTDPDGNDKLDLGSIVIVSSPAHGTATVNGSTGTVTYTPAAGFAGTDFFTYTISDVANATSNVARVTIVTGSGLIRGNAFQDFNASGLRGPDEPGLVGLQVYLDLNNNGVFDPNEPAAVTESDGGYAFTGLAGGDYTVRLNTAANPGTVQTSAASLSVTINADASIAEGQDFGAVPITTIAPVSVTPNIFPTGLHDANSVFVSGLYRNLLGRDPESDGLAGWVNALNQGGSTPGQVAQAIWESPEHRGQEVDHYYQTILGREPDAAGRDVWVRALLAGVGESNVILGFVNSPEFQAQHASNASFVDALYTALLGRPSDPSGAAFWTSALDAGQVSRLDVGRAFLTSTEAQLSLIDSYYAAFFQRATDTAGRDFWLNNLQNNVVNIELLASALLSSNEYLSEAASNVS
jgi:hypothetical protein